MREVITEKVSAITLPAAPQTSALEARIASIADWLEKNGDACFEEQHHLDEGSDERVYWHYGYLVALRDVVRLLRGGALN